MPDRGVTMLNFRVRSRRYDSGQLSIFSFLHDSTSRELEKSSIEAREGYVSSNRIYLSLDNSQWNGYRYLVDVSDSRLGSGREQTVADIEVVQTLRAALVVELSKKQKDGASLEKKGWRLRLGNKSSILSLLSGPLSQAEHTYSASLKALQGTDFWVARIPVGLPKGLTAANGPCDDPKSCMGTVIDSVCYFALPICETEIARLKKVEFELNFQHDRRRDWGPTDFWSLNQSSNNACSGNGLGSRAGNERQSCFDVQASSSVGTVCSVAHQTITQDLMKVSADNELPQQADAAGSAEEGCVCGGGHVSDKEIVDFLTMEGYYDGVMVPAGFKPRSESRSRAIREWEDKCYEEAFPDAPQEAGGDKKIAKEILGSWGLRSNRTGIVRTVLDYGVSEH